MKNDKIKTITLDHQGVDEASETIRIWLENAGLEQRDILRIRLTMEEVLLTICEHGDDDLKMEMVFSNGIGSGQIRIRYGGERFDPTAPRENELDEWAAILFSRTGIMPKWRWRANANELMLRIPGLGIRSEFLMMACIFVALAAGFLGQFLPEEVKQIATDYVLSFASDGFLNLLNTFIGIMIFLSIITGICGIGSASEFGRIGKMMISRFLATTFLTCAGAVFVIRFLFSLEQGGIEGNSQVHAIMEMIFGILPSNPIRPFLEGNTLQIVFLGTLVGLVLLMKGSEAEAVRSLIVQTRTVVMQCVEIICVLLPVYILSSLVMQFWSNGMGIFLQFGKPLLVCVLFSVVLAGGYLAVVCRKFKVSLSVLIPKLLPDFIIGLSTASSAAAMSTTLEINEKKLGIDSSFSRTAVPIGGMLFSGAAAMMYAIVVVFLAEQSGVEVNIAWWVSLWIICSLVGIASPPVAGGTISCLSIILLQMHIPQESLVIGATLVMLLDFITTGLRVLLLHCEVLFQSDRLKLLDLEILRNP